MFISKKKKYIYILKIIILKILSTYVHNFVTYFNNISSNKKFFSYQTIGTIRTRPYVQKNRFVRSTSDISGNRTKIVESTKNLHTVLDFSSTISPKHVNTNNGLRTTVPVPLVPDTTHLRSEYSSDSNSNSMIRTTTIPNAMTNIRDTVVDIRSVSHGTSPPSTCSQTNIYNNYDAEALKIYNKIKVFDSTIDESLGTLNKKIKKISTFGKPNKQFSFLREPSFDNILL